MTRARGVVWWLLPSAFCLAVYWHGLNAWFQADDFAWLLLKQLIHSPADFWRTMFEPMAQGTIRPLSERGFFLLFETLFGLDALPYRIWVFLTQFANLLLLSWIVLKLTGSRAAGFWAAILWTANASLAMPMSWSSDYNQVLCAFFLMSAFALFLKYRETGKAWYYWFQFAVFLLGFGALEINVVYPALALAGAILCGAGFSSRRKLLFGTLPLFAISALFTIIHMRVAPKLTTGTYALHFDRSIPVTLGTYWRAAFVPREWVSLRGHPAWVGASAFTVLSAALLVYALVQARRGRLLPAFGIAWFLITLSPVLPLRDHIIGYYLMIPCAGLSITAADAFCRAWTGGIPWRLAGAGLLAVYLAIALPMARVTTKFFYDRSRDARNLVLGVETARELHPGKAILLTKVTDELYDTVVAQAAFRVVGVPDVYLAPESLTQIKPFDGDFEPVSTYVLPLGPTLRALADDQLVVYQAGGERLTNVTTKYQEQAARQGRPEEPRRVDVSNPLLSYLLGPTWYPPEGTFRWMPKQATVRLGGPRRLGERLYLTAYCPEDRFRSGPVRFQVSVDGSAPVPAEIARPENPFQRSFALPPKTMGKSVIEISITMDHAYEPPGAGRELGLAFGVFEIY